MDNLFVLMVVAAIAVVIFVYLRFGKSAAAAAGAVLALLIAYARGRMGAKAEVENDQLRERVRNDEKRNEAERRAEDAADRVRVDNARGGLRDDDGFRRD